MIGHYIGVTGVTVGVVGSIFCLALLGGEHKMYRARLKLWLAWHRDQVQ